MLNSQISLLSGVLSLRKGADLRRRRYTSSLLPILLALAGLSCPAIRAGAAPSYVAARDLAKRLGVQYKDLSDGNVHACKLHSKNHQAVFSAGIRSVSIDGKMQMLGAPARWNTGRLEVPAEARRVVANRFGIGLPPEPAGAAAESRKTKLKVVIDPGHGGHDPGAIGPTRLYEKTVTLDVSHRLAKLLKANGVQVVMTRRTDIYVELDDRIAISNRSCPDLFVSVHANSVASRRYRQPAGSMTLYPDDGPKDGRANVRERARQAARTRGAFNLKSVGAGGTVSGRALLAITNAALESNRLLSMTAAAEMQESLKPVTGTWSRNNGVIEDYERGLRVLRGTHSPAVLVEMDFLSNRVRERKLKTASYRAAIAKAMCRGILSFLKRPPGSTRTR